MNLNSPFAGIPAVFLKGSIPTLPIVASALSLALNGKSENYISQFVKRNHRLGESPPGLDWDHKIGVLKTRHEQIQHASSQATFTWNGTTE